MRVDSQKKALKKTLPQIIMKHFMDLQHETAISGAAFVATVREHYESTYLEHAREIEFSMVPDAHTRMTRDYEKFKRWFEPGVKSRLPAEILESVIAAFPDDRRKKLELELAQRRGLLCIEMPETESTAELSTMQIGKVCKESGEVVIAVSKLVECHLIPNPPDEDSIDAIREIDESVAAQLAMKNAILERMRTKNNVASAH